MMPTAVGLLTAAALLLLPPLANADNASTLTVVGTSDVSDSGLVQNVLQPQFHAAFPQYTFKYVGKGTGAAITSAESGSDGASVLIVHAPSLENQFVSNGFSAEPFGRAIFINDFVFAGPTGDPAGVGANGSNNIAQAFADVAAAGFNGGGTPTATFVSRGGTPGTTVEEHAIWQFVDANGLTPTGVLLCAVNSTNGGGETPIAPGNGVTQNGQQCPGGGALPTGGALPSWYVVTSQTQGPNVVTANACNGFPSGPNSCYVLTDRGTYDNLAAGNAAAAAAGGISNLKVVTRGPQSASAPGGQFALVNYFHAYIINPSKLPGIVNLTAAQNFVNMLTSPSVQGQLKFYLNSTTDSAGAPFIATASPAITASGLPATAHAGKSVTVSGSVTNLQPGFPAIASKPVSVDELEGGVPVPVGTGTTDAAGNYSISFVPGSSGTYQVSTGQIQMIENDKLSPVFGDLLSPAASSTLSMNVQSSVTIASAKSSTGGATISGKLLPAAPDGNARVVVLARRQGSNGSFSQVGGVSLGVRQSSYAVSAGLQPGKWQLQTSFQDPGQLVSGTSPTVSVTVPNSTPSASFKRLSVKNGRLTLTGALSQAPTTNGTVVRLFALQTNSRGSFRQIAKTSVKPGHTTFTIKAKLKRGVRWVLQLEFSQKGQPTTFSRVKTINVH
jgi:ABC-type tungstate transport system permease subunit